MLKTKSREHANHEPATSSQGHDSVLNTLTECGAVLRGHFLLASGRHSDVYVEKFRILERPDVLAQVCKGLVEYFRGKNVGVVAGPSTGGMIVAYEVARQLEVQAVYVESEDG